MAQQPNIDSPQPEPGDARFRLSQLNIRKVSQWITVFAVVAAGAIAAPGAQLWDLWLAAGAAPALALPFLPALWTERRALLTLLASAAALAVGMSRDYDQRTVYSLLIYLGAVNAGIYLERADAFAATALIGAAFAAAKAAVLLTRGFPYALGTIGTDLVSFFLLTILTHALTASQQQIGNLHRLLVEKTQRTETELELTLELLRDMVLVVNREGLIISISPACQPILGYTPAELTGRRTTEFIHPDDRDWTARKRHALGDGEVIHFDNRFIHRSGAVVWLQWSAGRFEGESIIRCVARDITARKQTEMERARLAAIVEATPDYIAIVAPNGDGLYLNQAGRDLADIRPDAACPMERLFTARSLAAMQQEAIPAAMRDGTWHGEMAWRDSKGSEVPVSQVILAHKGPDGAAQYLTLIARDLSERRRHEAELTYRESHDSLTGLLNRRGFMELLGAGLVRSRTNLGAVLIIDLDEFKDINDALGQSAGDVVICHVAAVLRQNLRPSHFLARLGGDEFAVFLPGTGAGEAQHVAAALLAALRRNPCPAAGREVHVTASIGIAVYPEHGPTGDDLLAHADQAMFQAKEKGRNVAALFTPDSGWSARMETRFAWEQAIRRALEERGLVLLAQPIMALATRQVSHYELLLRMMDGDGELLPPDAFLPIAERYGLIHEIDRWVVREAIWLLHRLEQAGRTVSLEVNLSGKALTDSELLAVIRRELAASGVEPSRLVLEVTETAAIADFDMARDFVGTLKALGCRLALDDFGTGFSSFDRLKRISVDYLKLDGSFIKNLPADAADRHLVRAMVGVAGGLGKQTIAEFVESAETLAILEQLGVDYAQGYHVGRPRPVQEIWPEAQTEATAG